MNVLLSRADNTPIYTRLDLSPVRYGAAVEGGPTSAEIAVTGDRGALMDALGWLDCDVQICNDGGLLVWWGVVQAVSVTLAGTTFTLDAGPVVNAAAVVYTDTAGKTRATDYVSDAHSIALYGRRESRSTAQADDDGTALLNAQQAISQGAEPLREVQAGGGADGGKLTCIGYWQTMDRTYWVRTTGQLERDQDADATELLGWQASGDDFGFYPPEYRIGTLGATLSALAPTDRLIVVGSASNDGTYEVTEADDRAAVTTYTTDDTFYFDTIDDVHDLNGYLNQFREGDLIEISGTEEGENSGPFFIKQISQASNGSYNHMTVHPETIQTEGTGATVTVTAGNSIAVEPRPPADELPGAAVTARSQAQKLAMGWTVPAGAMWELSEVWVKAARVGNPTDNLKIELCMDAAGAPGTVAAAATVTGADLPLLESIDWRQWVFSTPMLLFPTFTYWLVVSRTGSASTDAYRLGIREAAEGFESADALLLYDGSDWISRTVRSGLGAALGLRIYSQKETTAQILDIVATAGTRLAATAIRTPSGIYTRKYRGENEAQTALADIRALLEFGAADGRRLTATVTAGRVLQIDAQRDATDPAYQWVGGELRDRWGLALPQGFLPVGEWVSFGDLVGGEFAPAFLESAEYDAATGAVRPSFRKEQPIRRLARLASRSGLASLARELRPLLK